MTAANPTDVPSTLIELAWRHLLQLGLCESGSEPRWELLGGGVSNWVLRFDCGGGVVVKQALPRLRVRDEWLADPGRALLEGKALLALGERLGQGDVPRVLFLDEQAFLLGMTSAPADAVPWKAALLRGELDPPTAARVGSLLGRMHASAWSDADLAAAFDDLALFRQLRLDPYHEHTARILEARGEQDLATLVRQGRDEMTARRLTLVHGDFSPKNLLVHKGGVMVIDFEVAHWGNPDFDTAFLLTHLVLKAVHLPKRASQYRAAAEQFFLAYREELGQPPGYDPRAGALRQAGCLLLARADGKSPVEYLDDAGYDRARMLGARLLLGEITDPAALFAAAGAV